MIEDVVRAIKAALPECTAGEVADALWLAAMGADAEARGEALPAGAALDAAAWPGDGPVEEPAEAEDPSDARVTPPDGSAAARGGPAAAATMVGLRAPEGTGHPGAAVRAMALFRRVHRPGRPVLDLDATVEATADARRLVVLTRPALERGLDVAIVVDRSPVTALWSGEIDRFADALRRTGAFRLATRWSLEPAEATLLVRDANGNSHQPQRLIDATGNRLILVMTDAVADHWYAPPVWAALRRWGRAMPTTIVNLLPAEHWSFTAPGRPSVALRSRRPAGPNTSAETRTAWWCDDETDVDAVPIPVVGLRPDTLEQWAQAVGAGGAWAEAVWAQAPPRRTAGETNARLTPEDRVRAFQLRSSPEAQALAAVLAGSPVLSLPLIQVLQQRLLGSTDPVPLSEIMVGGLLQAIPDGWIRFRPGVAEQLSRGMTTSREWDTFEVLSEYLEQHAGSGAAVQALFLDPRGAARVDPGLEPFAAMGQQVARKLGVALTSAEETTSVAGTTTAPAPATAETAERGITRHRFAKVVVIGDSGVGKSALAVALTRLHLASTATALSRAAGALDTYEVHLPGDEIEVHEIYPSDFPDPSRYHLPNRSRLTDLVIAVVVVDGSGTDPRSAAERWGARIDRVSADHRVAKLLVSNKTHQARTGLDRKLVESMGFIGYVETDAAYGTGVPELRAAIRSAIDWSRAPYLERSPNAARIAAVLDERRRNGLLTATVAELVHFYRERYGADLGEPEMKDFLGAERRIGRAAQLRPEDIWLLEPRRLEESAERIRTEARGDPDGMGTVSEARLTAALTSDFVPDRNPLALLRETIAEMVAAGHLLRISTDEGWTLTLPDLWPTQTPRSGELVDSMRYTFEGPTAPVRSGVAARVAYSSEFRLQHVNRDGAVFRGPSDGVCGFGTNDDPGLTVFFHPNAGDDDRAAFLRLVDAQLADQLGPDAFTKTPAPAPVKRRLAAARPSRTATGSEQSLLEQAADVLLRTRHRLSDLVVPARGWVPLQTAMTDALSNPPTRISDVLAIQVTAQAILDQLPPGPASNRVAAFNKLYLTITRRIDVALQTTAIWPEFLELLAVEFAKRYFAALDRWNHEQEETPEAWAVLFKRAEDLEMNELVAAILGVNAHINHDLPLALISSWEKLEAPVDDRIEPDYLLLNQIFYEEIRPLRRGFSDSWQMELDRLVGPLDDWSQRVLVKVTRAQAWEQALQLWPLRNDIEDFEQARVVMDRAAALLGEWLLFNDRVVTDSGDVMTGGWVFLRRLLG